MHDAAALLNFRGPRIGPCPLSFRGAGQPERTPEQGDKLLQMLEKVQSPELSGSCPQMSC